MTQFLHQDFLLDTEEARRLYHDVAADLPIVDYHNHLPPAEVAQDHAWDNLGDLWLSHDHYKWRVMRWAGVPESHITGNATHRKKFDAFARILPKTLGNPMYHWSHLELWRYFGLDGQLLNADSAEDIWQATQEKLASPEFRAQGLLKRMKVELIGTTDDPLDSLEHHQTFSASAQSADLKMVPTFRPDRAMAIEAEGFHSYLEQLEALTSQPIVTFDDLIKALLQRLEHFTAHGCRAADHGIGQLTQAEELSSAQLDKILQAGRQGKALTSTDAESFRMALLLELGRAYARADIVMQLHIGPLRNNSSRILTHVGRDSGADSMQDLPLAAPLNHILDRMDRTDELPRTILYALDPSKNPVIVTTAGNFQGGGVAGKVQAGTAWWFNDQLDGMEDQMNQLAQMGLLSTFTGMLTDSRSFLSFPRHEYFRRLVCRIVGRWVADGLAPQDQELLDGMIADICYHNARRWFIS
ncbi:glucuronate isomerase [Halomonas sp. MCCC 1A11036]|uniref:Uronate isomerase n=1 Tax=Billgrantia zhangzhouensis TaxID=2733481 RepID=A0ABS9ACG6_9GAMM|nr:glucuronate isomerase [Halomonas zhangzhouensis]MCE8019480.1 glucuronate isomerase [Halomonas zhangzhouensis]